MSGAPGGHSICCPPLLSATDDVVLPVESPSLVVPSLDEPVIGLLVDSLVVDEPPASVDDDPPAVVAVDVSVPVCDAAVLVDIAVAVAVPPVDDDSVPPPAGTSSPPHATNRTDRATRRHQAIHRSVPGIYAGLHSKTKLMVTMPSATVIAERLAVVPGHAYGDAGQSYAGWSTHTS